MAYIRIAEIGGALFLLAGVIWILITAGLFVLKTLRKEFAAPIEKEGPK